MEPAFEHTKFNLLSGNKQENAPTGSSPFISNNLSSFGAETLGAFWLGAVLPLLPLPMPHPSSFFPP